MHGSTELDGVLSSWKTIQECAWVLTPSIGEFFPRPSGCGESDKLFNTLTVVAGAFIGRKTEGALERKETRKHFRPLG